MAPYRCFEAYAIQKLVYFALDNNAKFDVYLIRLTDNDKRILYQTHYCSYELDVSVNEKSKTIRTVVQKNRLNGECI